MDDPGSVILDWYDAHAAAVYEFAARTCGDREWARDIPQEAFLRALAVIRARGEIRDPRAWLLRTAYNLIIDAWRRRGRVQWLPLDAARAAPDGDPSPEEAAVRAETVALVQQALERLPAQYRAILLLREREGMSYAEICHVMGISLEAVRSMLYRARLALRELLGAPAPERATGGEC